MGEAVSDHLGQGDVGRHKFPLLLWPPAATVVLQMKVSAEVASWQSPQVPPAPEFTRPDHTFPRRSGLPSPVERGGSKTRGGGERETGVEAAVRKKPYSGGAHWRGVRHG